MTTRKGKTRRTLRARTRGRVRITGRQRSRIPRNVCGESLQRQVSSQVHADMGFSCGLLTWFEVENSTSHGTLYSPPNYLDPRSKYPLAITARALKTLGPRLLQGYDIGCVFKKTIASSSLGTKFEESKSRCCVNAFHGYSHNFACQTKNHPNLIEGMGLEDLETMERIFSSSNQVAAVTRYSSAYHRRVFIDMFLQQWDDDKYQNLASMLYNNYRQALSIIDIEGSAVEETTHALGINTSDLEAWHRQQVDFFETIGEESPWDIHAVTYVELLQDLDSAT